jgi:glucosamine--fructose-6-phosphate aminotransferase (isomerizing)
MCIIAGYSGNKQAAPILIEMLRKTEYIDGGLSTGIATICDGKLHVRKVLGDVDTLLRETDALDLPGNTGIIHSRTSNDFISCAHPFLDSYAKLAVVENGTTLGTGSKDFFAKETEIMNSFLDRGMHAYTEDELPTEDDSPRLMKNGKVFYYIEPYAFMIGDEIHNSSAIDKRLAFAEAVKNAHSTLPTDNITLSIHADIPDTIAIGNITRPMTVGFGDGETYLATCPIAFPDDIQKCPVLHLPPTSVSTVTPSGVQIHTTKLDGVRVEQIDYRVAKFIREEMEMRLTGKENAPLSIYDLPILDSWLNIWSEPRVDCKYISNSGKLKQFAAVIYEGLWSFHKEGRLHLVRGRKTNNPNQYITRFWVDEK